MKFTAPGQSPARRLGALRQDTPSEYFYSVVVSFDIIKKAADGAVPIKLAAPGETAQITVSIDDDKLPPGMTWTLKKLVAALNNKYSDFLQNDRFCKLKVT